MGTLCYLSGWRQPEHAASGPLGGAIFETAVLAELVKTIMHRGEEPQIYFWRTAAGLEVDFIVASGGKLHPLEAKLSATPKPAMAQALYTFQHDFAGQAGPGYLIHPGEISLPVGPNVTALPLAAL